MSNYKTFKQWIEVKMDATNPVGPTGGPNPVEDTKKELANKVSSAAKAGQDPKKIAQDIIQNGLKKAGASPNANIKDIAKLADAAKELSPDKMKKSMKK